MSNKKWVIVSVIAIASILAFFFLNNRPSTLLIQNAAMMPTIGNGDFVVVDPSVEKSLLKGGDVIMYEIASAPGVQSMGRVVAIGGEEVAIEDGTVLINGKAIQGSAGPKQVNGPEGGQFEERVEVLSGKTYSVWLAPTGSERSSAKVQVPSDAFFILSDNRSVGHDSRKLGAIPASGVRGKVVKIHSSAVAERNGKDL